MPCCEFDYSVWPQGGLLTLPDQVLASIAPPTPLQTLLHEVQWKLSEEEREVKDLGGRTAVLGSAMWTAQEGL